ncbi:hypothetical protein ILYODFUR_006091 [Ilyodon furcidens]|uniref:Uncharacterized protein n=1 Tax=Ilyodon furcidens TaxID=33524 RepID=A0ABV0TGD7_9TELE
MEKSSSAFNPSLGEQWAVNVRRLGSIQGQRVLLREPKWQAVGLEPGKLWPLLVGGHPITSDIKMKKTMLTVWAALLLQDMDNLLKVISSLKENAQPSVQDLMHKHVDYAKGQ